MLWKRVKETYFETVQPFNLIQNKIDGTWVELSWVEWRVERKKGLESTEYE